MDHYFEERLQEKLWLETLEELVEGDWENDDDGVEL